MSTTKIWLGPVNGPQRQAQLGEGVAAGTITPGELVARTSATAVAAASSAATVFGQLPLIATESGISDGGTVDTDYVATDLVYFAQIRSGEYVNVRMAVGQTLALDTALATNGDGTFKVAATDGTEEVLLHAGEVVASTTANQLVKAYKL